MKDWTITYNSYIPEEEPLRETLCTLGNGYFATRGAAEEYGAVWPHYPGTYLAGGYNRLVSEVAGRNVENEDLVNWPNWLCMTFRPMDGSWLDLNEVKIKEFNQELNIKEGILKRTIRFLDSEERETTLICRRIVSMDDPHVAAIQWQLIPHNWSGKIQLSSGINGNVINNGVARYRSLKNKHLRYIDSGRCNKALYLTTETVQSNLRMTQAARTEIYKAEKNIDYKREIIKKESFIGELITIDCPKEEPVFIEKTVSIYSSKDFAISEVSIEAKNKIEQCGRFEDLLSAHIKAWQRHWNRCDIEMDGDPEAKKILRFHIFHLLQVASMNSTDLDIGIPSRGWHGEAYRGHIFWDELFIFPFLNLRIPELARELMMYRYRRLGEAREMAKTNGYKGAMFPWQSGSNGREESQVVHLNPLSGKWVPDNTHHQRHVNAAIAHNVWHYYQVTEDKEFLYFYGAELILEIARFWASYAHYNPERGRYDISQIVGPDEYHTAYPGSDEPGLKNNAYTNVLVIWCIKYAFKVLEIIDKERQEEIKDMLGLTEQEIDKMKDVSQKIFIPFHNDGILSQFEGYENLQEFDWKAYKKKYGDIQRLDRILGAEGDTPDNYKASKQADVLMLFYLFSKEELKEILSIAGYTMDTEKIPQIIEYYLQRTSHGSTLSRHIHSWVLARSERERSFSCFKEALYSDINDIQGGTTHEGIHLGAMAGTVDMVQRCYTGLEIRDDHLWLNPKLPRQITEIRLRVRYRGHWIIVKVSHERLYLHVEKGWAGEVHLCYKNEKFTMCTGETRQFELEPIATNN
ncbi:MAG: glycoside hydrolase family 65 protein [Cytophagaceae bacterium]